MPRRIDSISSEMARECLGVRLRVVDRVVRRIFDDALRPLGLRVTQLNLLVVIARLGTASPQDIGRILAIEASTLSRNLERMRERGWIETVDAADGRARPCRLTEEGRNTLRSAHSHWRRAQDETEELLGAACTRAIRRVASREGELANSPEDA